MKISDNAFIRTESLIGKESLDELKTKSVAVFGIGGVGSYVIEALARSGIGHIALIDKDIVDESNINRQLIALHSTVGVYKTEVAEQRIKDINPDCKVSTYNIFYLPETQDCISLQKYDYVVDAIDTVTGKLCIIENAQKMGVPVISSMGTGNKLDATAFEVADIYETTVCPLAKVMRKECKARGIKNLKVVYSKEEPILKDRVPASISFVPSVAGLILAGEVIKDLIKKG